MEKITITLSREYLKDGLKCQATREGKTLSQYAEEVLSRDLAERLGFRIVGLHQSGAITQEKQFYSGADFAESVRAYKATLDDATGAIDPLKGFKAYAPGKEPEEHGEPFIEPFSEPLEITEQERAGLIYSLQDLPADALEHLGLMDLLNRLRALGEDYKR